MNGFADKVSFIWSVADLLRGDYKQSEYGRVILPLTVLRRLDCVLAPTRDAVLDVARQYEGKPELMRSKLLSKAAGAGFYNTSPLDLTKMLGDPANIAANLTGYIAAFSPSARDIMEHFRYDGTCVPATNCLSGGYNSSAGQLDICADFSPCRAEGERACQEVAGTVHALRCDTQLRWSRVQCTAGQICEAGSCVTP